MSPWRPDPFGRSPFRETTFTAAWLAGSGDRLGMTDLEFRTSILPLASEFLKLTPGFAVHFLDGPRTVDLPPRLYDAWLDIAARFPVGSLWLMELAVRPGFYGDYEHINSDTFRIQGRALGLTELNPTLKLGIGVVYLDREDIPVLPVGGLFWAPDEDTQLDLIFPLPKIARRVCRRGGDEHWVYLGGEFGGNSYSIERANGTNDVASYLDFRLFTGVEARRFAGVTSKLELGYIFHRRVEYESSTPRFDPKDTVMMRAILSY